MTTARRIARGVSVQVVGRVVSVAISIFTLALTTRYLGAEGFGLLTTAVLFSGVFQAFTDLEIGTVIVRRVGGGKGDLDHLVGVNLGASLVYAVPLALVSVVASFVVYPGARELQLGIAILSVGLALTVLSSCYRPPYELAIRFEALTASDLVSRALALVFTVLIIRFDLGITAVFVVQIIPNAVELLMIAWLSRRFGAFRPIFQLPATVSLFREALPLAAVNLIAILYYRADGVLLSVLSDEAQVGAYGLGYRLAGNLGVVSMAFLSAVIATMVRAYAAGRASFAETVTGSLKFMTIFAVPIATLGVMVAPSVLTVLAGDPLASLAVVPTQAILIATALGFLNSVAGQALVTSHHQRPLVVISLFGLVANIVLNLILIPRYAAVGAGISLVATEAMGLVASQALLYRTAGVLPPLGFVVRLVPATLAGVAAWYVARDWWVLWELGLVAVGYFVGLAVFGPVSLAEARRILSRGSGESGASGAGGGTPLEDANPRGARPVGEEPAE